MKNFKEYWNNSPYITRVLFWVLLVLGVAFIIASWFVPPMGVIDSSVLAAFGEIQGFASIGVGLDCLFRGMNITMKKGDTEISVEQNTNKNI